MFPPGYHPNEQAINRQVLNIAGEQGMKVYLVGGYIRDALAQRYSPKHRPVDFDYTVSGGSAVALAQHVADKLHAHFVMLDEGFDTARVVMDDGSMCDFAGCIGGSINTDIQRRDFTINALAWDPDKPDTILDLVNGLDDLRARIIRSVAEDNFKDDPLRLLRAFRFAATMGGTIDPDTVTLISRHCSLLNRVKAERVSYEWFLIMETAQAGNTVLSMSQTGLLEVLFPELTGTRQVPPNAFHHLDLYQHSLEVLVQAEKHFPSMPDWCKQAMGQDLSQGISRLAATKTASLLHDIGKPSTWAVLPDGRHTFYGHDNLGAEMAEKTSLRLKWSKPVARLVAKLIKWHLRPGALFHQGPPTTKAVHRFYRNVGADFPELMLLALADLGATLGQGMTGREQFKQSLLELLEMYPVFLSGERKRERLLDGNDVINLLDITEGPLVGQLLSELAEAQGVGEVCNRSEAERFITELYRNKYER